MEKTRTFTNRTKIPQVYYDRFLNPILVKPGTTYVEDMRSVIDVNELVKKEKDRRTLEADVEENRRVKRAQVQVKIAKSLEDLDKLKEGETNTEVIDAILARSKELLDADKGRT